MSPTIPPANRTIPPGPADQAPGAEKVSPAELLHILDTARRNAPRVAELLAEAYPHAHSALNFSSPYELLIATVLSAQTTDQKVNQVTPGLFRHWPDPSHLAAAPLTDLVEVLGPLGLANRKAAALQGIGTLLVEKYGSEVPSTLEELMALPGVGRKTAHVVLGNWFGEEKISVDIHVRRVARRLGWTQQSNPVKVEEDLLTLLPDAPWTTLSHRLIEHGRTVCHARRPLCEQCVLREFCPQLTVVATAN